MRILLHIFIYADSLLPKTSDTLKVDTVFVKAQQQQIILKSAYNVQKAQVDTLRRQLQDPELTKKLRRKFRK